MKMKLFIGVLLILAGIIMATIGGFNILSAEVFNLIIGVLLIALAIISLIIGFILAIKDWKDT